MSYVCPSMAARHSHGPLFASHGGLLGDDVEQAQPTTAAAAIVNRSITPRA